MRSMPRCVKRPLDRAEGEPGDGGLARQNRDGEEGDADGPQRCEEPVTEVLPDFG